MVLGVVSVGLPVGMQLHSEVGTVVPVLAVISYRVRRPIGPWGLGGPPASMGGAACPVLVAKETAALSAVIMGQHVLLVVQRQPNHLIRH